MGRNRDNVNQGFLLPRELNDELETQLREKAMRKSEFRLARRYIYRYGLY
jgi:hypothetical protein